MKTSMKLEHQNIYFIGDTHHYHSNVIKFDKRPFENIKEHDEAIIRNWNNKVGKDDVVFHLGDISFASYKQTNTILEQLNGEIYLILGNHDKMDDVKKLVNIKEYFPRLDLYVKDPWSKDKSEYQMLVLDHYPILSWNKKHYNSWMIHGHCHGNLMKDHNYDWYYKQKVIDVGANCIDYTPISYQEIKDIMDTKLLDTL
jgi:calcineurin-like phosphoesterase family protein